MDLPKGIDLSGRRLRIRIQCKGKSYTRYTKPSKNPRSQATIAEALYIQRDLKARITLGVSLDNLDDTDGLLSIFFEDAAHQYMQQLDVEYSTANTYLGMLNRYWMEPLAGKLLTEIPPKTISRIVKRLDVSRKTKRNALGPLRGVFDWAIEEGYCTVNPCIGIRIRKHTKPEADPFSATEKTKILTTIQRIYGATSQRLVYYTLLFETGMRPSEALALHWSDYDGEGLRVNKAIVCGKHKSSTKNHENRQVYVSPELKRRLNNHTSRFEGRYVFPNNNGGPYLNNSFLDSHWRKILDLAKVRYRRPYTCRHTYASIGLSSGLEPGFLANQLGHSLEVFYRTYAKWLSQDWYKSQCKKLDEISRNFDEEK